MPTPLEANAIIQVRINGELFDQQCLNVLHYLAPNAETDFKAACAAAKDYLDGDGHLLEAICAFAGNSYRIKDLAIQPIYSQRLASQVFTNLTHNVGLGSGVTMQSNVSAVITKGTDFAGRNQVGSFHAAGVRAAYVSGDDLTLAAKVSLSGIAIALLDPIAAGDFGEPWKPILWTPEHPLSVQEVTTARVQETIRVMRRRTKGVGR